MYKILSINFKKNMIKIQKVNKLKIILIWITIVSCNTCMCNIFYRAILSSILALTFFFIRNSNQIKINNYIVLLCTVLC
jgi:hypothetical protein